MANSAVHSTCTLKWCLVLISRFILCNRHVIAIIHFNCNLHRENKKKQDGTEQIAVTYPKFKNGEATVQDIKVKANFSKYRILVTCLLIWVINFLIALTDREKMQNKYTWQSIIFNVEITKSYFLLLKVMYKMYGTCW